jgi:BMFP domain-containing protein YqiC
MGHEQSRPKEGDVENVLEEMALTMGTQQQVVKQVVKLMQERMDLLQEIIDNQRAVNDTQRHRLNLLTQRVVDLERKAEEAEYMHSEGE